MTIIKQSPFARALLYLRGVQSILAVVFKDISWPKKLKHNEDYTYFSS
jgi:hypothetical protein